MGLLSKLLGGQTADSPRTPRERARRSREIRKADAAWSRTQRRQWEYEVGHRKGR